MPKQSKVVQFYKKQLNALSLRVSKAEEYYLSCVKAKFRSYINKGVDREELKEREVQAYKQYFSVFFKYIEMYDKYLKVVGNESLCREESH